MTTGVENIVWIQTSPGGQGEYGIKHCLARRAKQKEHHRERIDLSTHVDTHISYYVVKGSGKPLDTSFLLGID